MKTEALQKYLEEQLKKEVDNKFKDESYCNAQFKPPECSLTIKTIGSWLWIKAITRYEGKRWDYTTDSSDGDSEGTILTHNWIGKFESAPEVINNPEELNRWSIINTIYEIHNQRAWGKFIKKIETNGKITIKEDSPSYEIETKTETINLNDLK